MGAIGGNSMSHLVFERVTPGRSYREGVVIKWRGTVIIYWGPMAIAMRMEEGRVRKDLLREIIDRITRAEGRI